MQTYTSIESYRKSLRTRLKKIGKLNSPLKAAKFMTLKAKEFAPRKTGETIRGIKRRKKGKLGYEVSSEVSPKGISNFRQNLWVNQTEPWLAPRMWWNKNKPTVYGDGTHRITGLPFFFNRAAILTKEQYIKITKKEVENILSRKF